jgi:hypothetical protein
LSSGPGWLASPAQKYSDGVGEKAAGVVIA